MIFSQKYEQLEDIAKYPDVRFVIINGGRGTGKSTFVSHFQHNLSFSSDHVILNTRFTMSSARDSVMAEMAKTIEDRGSEDVFEGNNNTIINNLTNAKIIFKGIKAGSLTQTANLKGITDLNVWIVDEAEELTDENTFDDANHSIRRKGYQNLVILILNSHNINKEHFIYQTFYQDKGVDWTFNGVKGNVMYIHTTFLDNWENLSDSIKAEIKQLKTYYDKYKNWDSLDVPKNFVKYINKYRYNFLGLLRDKAKGVVFSNWSFGKFDYSLNSVFVMDFGVVHPTTLTIIAIDEKLQKLYIKNLFVVTHTPIPKLQKLILEFTKRKNKLIIGDIAGKQQILDLQDAGFNILGSPNKNIITGISKMQDYDIIVDEEDTQTPIELNNYKYPEKNILEEKPIKEFDHIIDPVRYGVAAFKILW